MATCKDCIHYEVCAEEGIYFTEKYIKGATVSNDVKSLCHWFKNKLDYAKVKHGEWMEKVNTYNYSDEDFEYLECSICGNCSPVQNPTPYCSECGSKMNTQ